MSDFSPVCPYCGHTTVFKPPEWVEGGPLMCANPMCDSNHPPEPQAAHTEAAARRDFAVLRASADAEYARRRAAEVRVEDLARERDHARATAGKSASHWHERAEAAEAERDALRTRVEALADDMDERGKPGADDSPLDAQSRRQIREDAGRLRAVLAAHPEPTTTEVER